MPPRSAARKHTPRALLSARGVSCGPLAAGRLGGDYPCACRSCTWGQPARPGGRTERCHPQAPAWPEDVAAAADYAEPLNLNGVQVSLHPAGHILGSTQVRIEADGQVWVISGDYKTEGDATCAPFEPPACHTFVTESTFGLPVFNWQPQHTVLAAINHWWQANRDRGRTSLLLAYALGKAQRVLAGIDPAIGPIFTHATGRVSIGPSPRPGPKRYGSRTAMLMNWCVGSRIRAVTPMS